MKKKDNYCHRTYLINKTVMKFSDVSLNTVGVDAVKFYLRFKTCTQTIIPNLGTTVNQYIYM